MDTKNSEWGRHGEDQQKMKQPLAVCGEGSGNLRTKPKATFFFKALTRFSDKTGKGILKKVLNCHPAGAINNDFSLSKAQVLLSMDFGSGQVLLPNELLKIFVFGALWISEF